MKYLIFSSVLMFGLLGCSQVATGNLEIVISGTTISLEALEDETLKQLEYNISIQSLSESPIEIEWVEPIMPPHIVDNIVEKDKLKQQLNIVLEQKEIFKISNEVVLNTEKLTKDQLYAYSYIAGIHVHLSSGETFVIDY